MKCTKDDFKYLTWGRMMLRFSGMVMGGEIVTYGLKVLTAEEGSSRFSPRVTFDFVIDRTYVPV